MAQRKNILKKTGRCLVCLKRHPISKDCPSPLSCTRCNARHHTSICTGHASTQPNNSQTAPANYSTQTGRNSTQAATLPSTSQTPITVPPPIRSTTTGLYCVNVNTPVLFQTAQAYIHKPDDSRQGMAIRLILDGVSQRSYIAQWVKDALELEP